MASKFEIEIELKSPVQKVWKTLKEFVTFFPKTSPNTYEKIDVIEGDGKSAGSVIVSTFKPSELNPMVSTAIERIDTMDEEKKIMSYSFIEGEILKTYKNFKAIICVSSGKNNGTIIKYIAEFEKANADVPDPHFFRHHIVKQFHDVDDYLLKA